MADTTVSKRIQLKDKSGNLLYPEVKGSNIPDGGIDKAKLSQALQNLIDGKATTSDVSALKAIVDKLDGTATTEGSVKKQINDAVNSLVGTAPDTLNTLQKIAQELQDPSKNTASTVLDQVAGKADKSTTLKGYGISDAYTKAEVDGLLAGDITYSVVQ